VRTRGLVGIDPSLSALLIGHRHHPDPPGTNAPSAMAHGAAGPSRSTPRT
jgi:hypothetical protein